MGRVSSGPSEVAACFHGWMVWQLIKSFVSVIMILATKEVCVWYCPTEGVGSERDLLPEENQLSASC